MRGSRSAPFSLDAFWMGACLAVNLCQPDPKDDCLAEREPRAWSWPLWVSWGQAGR